MLRRITIPSKTCIRDAREVKDAERALCTGYVSGIGDYMWVIGVARKEQQLGLCASPSPLMVQCFKLLSFGRSTILNRGIKIPKLGLVTRCARLGRALGKNQTDLAARRVFSTSIAR